MSKVEDQKLIEAAEKYTGLTMKEKILEYLQEKKRLFYAGKSTVQYHSPTQIGLDLGKNYNTASSSVSPSLRKLVEEGLVIKNKERHYAAK